VIDLDDGTALRTVDASDMLGAVAALPEHVLASYDVGRGVERLPDLEGIASVVFCGMGGSAVAGDVLRQVFRERLTVPVEVNRSPILPAHAGPRTLVVVSSYSGDTSETLAAFREAVERGCRILAITGGGTLGETCAARGLSTVPVPPGFQPRAALGHLTFAMLGALESAGLLPRLAADVTETHGAIEPLSRSLGPDVPTADNPAKQAAVWLADRVPVVWGADGIGALAAMRWKTQMNENGKVPAWHSSMSELDHNEVVGWVEPFGGDHAVIALRHEGEHEELAARFALSADIVRDAGLEVREIEVSGHGSLATLLSLIVIGDFASCYVGLRRGIDPTPVDAIVRLKTALAGR
jgi:glucose/mannose-6-phosphate isomerase